MDQKSPTEMFAELVRMGFVSPAKVEPTSLMVPTAYISVPTTLAFASPPLPAPEVKRGGQIGRAHV
jgi:hypothetical protein